MTERGEAGPAPSDWTGSGPGAVEVVAPSSRRRNLAITALMLLLIAASAVAFVRAQTLKLERAAVRPVEVGGQVAPGCDCASEEVRLVLALREPATVSIAVVDDSGTVVKELASDFQPGKGRFHLAWDGKTAAGASASVGSYRLRATLPDEGRAVTFPQEVEVVTDPAGSSARGAPAGSNADGAPER